MTEAQRMIGDNVRGDREKDDFYATPSEATIALLNVEDFDGEIWEPCCGKGHIAEVLKEHGYSVEATDLVDRGYGQGRVDFLMEWTRRENIITNPPYKGSVDFLRKAIELAEKKVAFILPIRYLEGVERGDFFQENPPVRIWVFKRRISMMKEGEEVQPGLMGFAWFVFDVGHTGKTEIGWI